MFWVLFSVVKAETPSVVTCRVAVGSSCAAVTVDISVVALLSSVLEVVDTTSVVFGVVSSLAVVALLVATVAFE